MPVIAYVGKKVSFSVSIQHMLHKSLTHAYGGEVGYLFGVVLVGFLNPLYSHWTRLFRVIELL